MNTIISDISSTDYTISSRIDDFFSRFSVNKLLKKSNFYKEGGIPCMTVLKEILSLVFTGRNLYRTLTMNPNDLPFMKNTAYRFLNSSRYNWGRLLLLMATSVISCINRLTSSDRVNVLIADDSLYDRNRSKNVELLSRVFDHTEHKYVKGFKMLTIGWSDGATFLPAAFSLMSSQHNEKILCPMKSKIDKRSTGYKIRAEAIVKQTETLFKLLDSVKGLPARYLLFDSWYAFPKTIINVMKRSLDVICMLKSTSKIHYLYKGKWMDLKNIYKQITPSGKEGVIGSAAVEIWESKQNPDLAKARIVFVKDRHSSDWLAVLSTDTALGDDEIIRIYGKRWDIEVFFRMSKSHLALAKEFQGRSYDMMTTHTTIVFIRYMMLALEARKSNDLRTVGELFYHICDEIKDIRFATSLMILLQLLKRILRSYPVTTEDLANVIIETFINSLPKVWTQRLKISA